MGLRKISWSNIRANFEDNKVIIEILVIVIMVISLVSAHNSNRIASRALESSKIPWLKVVNVQLEASTMDTANFICQIKNYSDYPALDFVVNLYLAEKDVTQTHTRRAVIMPQQEMPIVFSRKQPDMKEIVRQIKSRQYRAPIKFIIRYNDIQGNQYKVTQEGRFDGDEIEMINFYYEGSNI